MNNVELTVTLSPPPPEIEYLCSFIEGILLRLGIDNWELGLLITDDAGIRPYNQQWRGLDSPTDVLSFLQNEGSALPPIANKFLPIGDMILSLDSIRRNARDWGRPYDEELRRVLIHGILHLYGLDHGEDDGDSAMLKQQEELLNETDNLIPMKENNDNR